MWLLVAVPMLGAQALMPSTAVGPPRGMVRMRASRTERILEKLDSESEGLGAGAAGTYEGLKRLDGLWKVLRDQSSNSAPPSFVTIENEELAQPTYDVCILGGTLGIFLASALQSRGLSCCVVERGLVAGRNQEWNLSLDEVMDLVEAGALEASDVDGAVQRPEFKEVLVGEPGTLVASHFGAVRAKFVGGEDVWLPQVLNVGVRPDVAVARARAKFEKAGGVVIENTACAGVQLCRDGVKVTEDVSARLVVDAMGNASPISRQSRAEANGGKSPAPSGACCVVGTASTGYSMDNSYGDLIVTNEDSRSRGQYFWEAFPARSIGEDVRTTYLFTYLDVLDSPEFSVMDMFEDYWKMLPIYQRSNAACFAEADSADRPDLVDDALGKDFKVKRCLYGLFPTYRDSPLQSRWDRIVAVGDASGTQSPLSFGGFGALTRHIERLSSSIVQAVRSDSLDKASLSLINPYTPNLAATWMFQKSFVVPSNGKRPADFVNRLMALNYKNMEDLGDAVLRPFNQDVVQPVGLLKVLALATVRDPANIPQLLYHIGPLELADWLRHFANMLAYDALHRTVGEPIIRRLSSPSGDHETTHQRLAFKLNRLADAWEYGSGNDYVLDGHADSKLVVKEAH